jgi:hypothetical protein
VKECTITGRCYSSAYTVALSSPVIRMGADARIMLHKAVEWVMGNEDDLALAIRRLTKLNARLRSLLLAKTGQSEQVVDGWLSTDSYFTAAEAKALRLVDEVIDALPARPMPATSAGTAPSAPTTTESEALLLSMLRCFGPIQTTNKAKLARSIGAWLAYSVSEL